jgi:HK97 family phage portal protein
MDVSTGLTVRRPTLPARVWRGVRRLARRSVGWGSFGDPVLARLWGGGRNTLAGVSVSEDTALNISAYWRGVALISGHIAAMPLFHYKRGKNGATERYVGSKLYKLLHDDPNEEMTSYTMREQMQAHLLTWGNAYAEIIWNTNYDPVALKPITPDRVEVFRDPLDLRIKYRIAPSNRIIQAEDILHIPGLGFDGIVGYSVINRARQSLGLTLAAERYGEAFFGNGASFGGALTSPDDLDTEQKKEVRAEIERLHQGPDRAHRFLLLTNGMTYASMGIPPEQAQFLLTRKFQGLEIARWLGIPPHMIFDLDRATFSNIEQQGVDYYRNTLWTWCERWQQEIERKLIAPSERNLQYVEFLIDGVLRADIKTRYDAYHIGRQGGWLTINEIRGYENLNPVGTEGDMLLAPLNMIPLDKAGEYYDKKINPPKPTALPPAQDPTAAADTQALKDDAAAANKRADLAGEALAEARAVAEQRSTELKTLCEQKVIDQDAYATARRELASAQAKVAELSLFATDREREAARLQTALTEAESRVAEQTRLSDEAQAARAVDARARTEAEADRARLTTRLEQAQASLRDVTTHMTSLRQEVLVAQQSEQRAARQRLQVDGELATARQELETLRTAGVEAREAVTATTAQLDALTAAHTRATTALTDATARVTALEGSGSEAEQARVEAESARSLAEQARDEAAARVRVAEEARAAAEALEAQHAEALGHHTAQLAEAEARVTTLEQAQQEKDHLVATWTAAREEAERARTSVETRVTAMTTRVTDLQTELEQQARALVQVTDAREAVARELTTALTRAEDADRALQASRAEAKIAQDRTRALETAQDAKRAKAMANRRARIVDDMARMIDREIVRLQAAQGSVEKVRQWMKTFYENHEEVCLKALRRDIEDHIIHCERSEDPDVLTRELVQQHITESKADIAALLEGDADTLPARVAGLAERWRRERPEKIAAVLMEAELAREIQPPKPVRMKKIVKRDALGRIAEIIEEPDHGDDLD